MDEVNGNVIDYTDEVRRLLGRQMPDILVKDGDKVRAPTKREAKKLGIPFMKLSAK